MIKESLKPYLLIVVGYLLWSVTYSMYRYLFGSFIDPYAMASITLVVSGIICVISLLFGKMEKIDKSDFWKFVVAGLLMGLIKKGLLMVGMSDTTPIDASIIASIGPVMVLIISVMLKIDQITAKKALGITLGLLGTCIIIFNSDKGGTVAPHRMLGNAIIFLSTLSSSIYLVWVKDLMAKYKPGTLIRGFYIIAAVLALPFALYYAPKVDYHLFNPNTWIVFLYVALIPTLLPNLLFLKALKTVKPTMISIYAYIMPVVATILSIVLHQDKLSVTKAVASVIVFIGVYLVIRSYHQSKNPVPPHHSME